MKPFRSNRHEKWALTALLLAVLGFNLSAPLQKGLHHLDLASTADKPQADLPAKPPGLTPAAKQEQDPNLKSDDEMKTMKVRRNGKEYTVYLHKEGGKTVALVPYEAEGRVCEAGGSCMSRRPLDLAFDANLSDLETALSAKIDKARGDLPARVAEKDDKDDSVVDDRSPEERKHERKSKEDKKALERVARACKSDDEGERKSKCLTKELISLLRDRKGDRKIDADLALDFFEREIHDGLKEMLKKADSPQAAMDMIRDLLGRLPSGYNKIREAANALNTETLRAFANRVNQMKMQSDQLKQQATLLENNARQLQASGRTQEALQATQQLMQLRQMSFNMEQSYNYNSNQLKNVLFPSIYGNTFYGLQDALSSNYIEKDFGQSLLNNLYSSSNSIITGLQMPLLTDGTFTLPINIGTNGQPINVQNGRVLVPNFRVISGPGGSITQPANTQQPNTFGTTQSPILNNTRNGLIRIN